MGADLRGDHDWSDSALRRLLPTCEYWLSDVFGLAELYGTRRHRAAGWAIYLDDLLVADLPHKSALLSVMHGSERGRRLYLSRGWQTSKDDLRFPTEPRTPYSLFGLAL